MLNLSLPYHLNSLSILPLFHWSYIPYLSLSSLVGTFVTKHDLAVLHVRLTPNARPKLGLAVRLALNKRHRLDLVVVARYKLNIFSFMVYRKGINNANK